MCNYCMGGLYDYFKFCGKRFCTKECAVEYASDEKLPPLNIEYVSNVIPVNFKSSKEKHV